MGRQIAVVATYPDEQDLLRHIRKHAEVRLFVDFASTIEGLWTDEIAPNRAGNRRYRIRNTAFPWVPEYGQVGPKAQDRGCVGWHFFSNGLAAPVVDLARSTFSPLRPGRLYWAKDFGAPDGLDYDVAAFSKWFDSIARWARRQGTRQGGTFYLPDAWARRAELR
jgi:hypothetical protein